MTTWEERQAAKAHARKEEADSVQDHLYQEREAVLHEQYVSAMAETMSPAGVRAARLARGATGQPACACVGGPLCCLIRFAAEDRVLPPS